MASCLTRFGFLLCDLCIVSALPSVHVPPRSAKYHNEKILLFYKKSSTPCSHRSHLPLGVTLPVNITSVNTSPTREEVPALASSSVVKLSMSPFMGFYDSSLSCTTTTCEDEPVTGRDSYSMAASRALSSSPRTHTTYSCGTGLQTADRPTRGHRPTGGLREVEDNVRTRRSICICMCPQALWTSFKKFHNRAREAHWPLPAADSESSASLSDL